MNKTLIENSENDEADSVETVVLIIYQKEPHAGQMAFKNIRQPESIEERIELASRMKDEYEMPMPVLVDTMQDQSRARYSELPSPVFIIGSNGLIKAKFPWPDAEQIREALEQIAIPSPNAILKVADLNKQSMPNDG